MLSRFSNHEIHSAILTLDSINEAIGQIVEWNEHINKEDDYYASQTGMQLLAANCMLITAIGEGVNRINKTLPGFLEKYYPQIPWRNIIGMRNHIAHGYFEIDSSVVFEAVKNDIPKLRDTITLVVGTLHNHLSHSK